VALSLGPHLTVDGHNTNLRLPFSVLAHLPAIDAILPLRFALITAACTAGVVAFGLDHLWNEPGSKRFSHQTTHAWRRSWTWLCVATAIVVVSWLPAWPYPSERVVVPGTSIISAMPPGEPVVLAYPYPTAWDDQAQLWQAATEFRFRLLGVYAMLPGRANHPTFVDPLLDPPGVQEYLVRANLGRKSPYPAPPPLPTVISETRQLINRFSVGAILVDTSAVHGRDVTAMFTAAMGPAAVSSGPFKLWTLLGSRQSHPLRNG
jgi:hypothetical protein